jgi:hypothetical protein
MIATNHHSTIHLRILKMCIVESTGITNGRRTAELIKETVLIGSETNYLIKGLSAHGGVLGLLLYCKGATGPSGCLW